MNNSKLNAVLQDGDLLLIKKLIHDGVDIHVDDDYALRFASYNGHLSVVKYLVESGSFISG